MRFYGVERKVIVVGPVIELFMDTGNQCISDGRWCRYTDVAISKWQVD